ncbi:MAG TPA: hypothetical protein VMT22_19370, partial [Terriglobales bacterium]|nr:hypothetical protein [Terriglobales bacterium]
MPNVKLGITKNPRFEPLIDGTVKSTNLNLDVVVTTPPELFYRNLTNDEFDVFEMSLSEYLVTRERAQPGRWQWSALPIFPSKAFLWLGLFVSTAAGIDDLSHLRGKRVGIPDYVMTAALWFRVFLRELYDIQPREISWFIGRTQDLSHGGALGMAAKPPPDVSLTWLTAQESFDVMLDQGRLDAAYGFVPHHDRRLQTIHNIDRYGGTPIEGNPHLRKLFTDDGRSVVATFFKKTGVVPANHVIVAQRRVLEQNPWIGGELLQLFTASKQAAYVRSNFSNPAYLYFPGIGRAEQMALSGDDPFPYGIKTNRPMLEMLFRNSHVEGLTQKLAKIEEVFYPA